MRLIHVGLGAQGRHWFEAAARLGGSTAVAAVDSDPAERQWAGGKQAGLPLFEKLETALAEVKADALLVADEPELRTDIAIQGLQAGLAVMVVSPAAIRVSEVRRLSEASQQTAKPLVAASKRRFLPAYIQLAGFIRRGWIGAVTHASVMSTSALPANDRLGRAEYSQLLAQGAEDLEAIALVLGAKPASVICRSISTPWTGYRHGSTTEIFLELDRNIQVHYHGSLSVENNEHEVWIEGQKGTLWTDGQRLWWRKRGWPRFVPLLKSRQRAPEILVLRQLETSIRAVRSPHADGAGLVEQAALVESAIRSDQGRCAVSIADVLHGTLISGNPTLLRASGAIL